MATKPTLKYRMVTGMNPRTGDLIITPRITDRSKMDLDQVVDYAIKGGYVTGQKENMKGVLQGFIQAMKELGLSGYDVSLDGWLRIHGELTGTVDETGTLTSDNTLKVNITALKDLKRDIEEFSWELTGLPEKRVRINGLASVGEEVGIIRKEKEIVATGRNLYYSAALGDSVTIAYEGLETPIAIVPSESDDQHMKWAWPTALASVEDGTVLTFKFTLHAGVKESMAQVLTKVAVFRT